MCTLSWWIGPQGYDVFVNRDELKARAPESPPSVCEAAGVRYVAPTDGAEGGTWALVNAFGLTLTLVNHYPEHRLEPVEPIFSRGLLARALAGCHTVEGVEERLARQEVAHVRPFFLVAVQPKRKARLWRWDGVELATFDDNGDMAPLASSSWHTSEVVRWRRERFLQQFRRCGRLHAGDLERFHRLHDPAHPPFSPCMLREDAETTSLIHICVRPGLATMHYLRKTPGLPTFEPPEVSNLELQGGIWRAVEGAMDGKAAHT